MSKKLSQNMRLPILLLQCNLLNKELSFRTFPLNCLYLYKMDLGGKCLIFNIILEFGKLNLWHKQANFIIAGKLLISTTHVIQEDSQ